MTNDENIATGIAKPWGTKPSPDPILTRAYRTMTLIIKQQVLATPICIRVQSCPLESRLVA